MKKYFLLLCIVISSHSSADHTPFVWVALNGVAFSLRKTLPHASWRISLIAFGCAVTKFMYE